MTTKINGKEKNKHTKKSVSEQRATCQGDMILDATSVSHIETPCIALRALH